LERRSCNKEKKKNKMKIRQSEAKEKTKKENLLLHLIHILKDGRLNKIEEGSMDN
jgi:hypothetical protein